MEQLVNDDGKRREEIADLRQIIHTLETVNEVLKSQVKTEPRNPDSSDWAEIEDQEKIFNVLSSYQDSIKKLILEEMTERPMTIQEIVQKYGLPQASTYRRITELIDCGLIVKHGFFLQNNSKRVYKYAAAIKNMKIIFRENKVKMLVLPARKKSSIQKLCENTR